MNNIDFKRVLRHKAAWAVVCPLTIMLLAGGQTALATHVPLALDVPFLWTPMPNDGYLEFINPAEYAVLPMGIPVPGTPPGVIMTEEYTGYTTAAGADIIEVGDSDTTAGDRADFDWVQENRFCELGGPCANGPVNHPGFVGAMGWIAGATEASPHIDPGTGGAHGHSIQEIPPGPLPYLPNEDYYPREFFSGVDVFSIISEGQDATFELASPGGREAALDYNVAFGNTITGFGSPGIPILVFAPGWTAATTIDDFVARWVPVVPGLYNVIAIEPETGATGHDDITEIDAVKAWFVPEPSSIGLMLVGLLGFGLKCRRRMT